MNNFSLSLRRTLRSFPVIMMLLVPFACDKTPSADEETGQESQDGATSMTDKIIMDIKFDASGSAEDVSSRGNTVRSLLGSTVLIYYNSAFESYVPRFYNTPGTTPTNGYYRAEYLADRTFQSSLGEGFTLETMFLLDSEPSSDRMSVFSSVEDGGAGIFVAPSTMNNEIAFEMYTSNGPSTNLVTLRSGITPEKGKAYHVVGVWDKEAAEARLYVNGQLESSFGTSGDLVLPSNVANRWFGIGCDAGLSSTAQTPFRGDIYLARVYSGAASGQQAALLKEEAPDDVESSVIMIDDLLTFPACNVKPGGKYMVLGSGFKQGDEVRMTGPSAPDGVRIQGEVTGGHIAITLPGSTVAGTHRFYVLRNGAEAPLGVSYFYVADEAATFAAPGVIAHRGYHSLPGVPENSIAALKASQQLGVYGCEIDVWTTTDGKIVVHHDGILSGKTIQNCTYDEVSSLTLSNGETLPLFTDMLDVVSTSTATKLIIEIKEHSTKERNNSVTDEVIRLVTEKGMDDYVEYICFDRDVCARIAAAKPEAVIGYLRGDYQPSDLTSYGINCIDYPFATLNSSRTMITSAHELGMKVNIWTVNTDEDILSSIGMGVDYITTDHPDRILEIVSMMQ